ncbi:MAG TPA: phage tail protein [Symbiobacteriaceae bacterium]|nr:phage tail protein [Symbiobacteriaceae bacterium]
MRRQLTFLMAALLVLSVPFLMGPASPRSYVSGNYMLELDGVQTGFVKSVKGGNVYAEVINEAAGPDYFVRKHIGQPKYEDFEVQIGFSMTKPIYDWISASWKMNYQRKNGAVIAADYNYIAQSRRDFTNALITETTIPAMDAASKEPGYLTLKFAPESIRNTKASGGKAGAAASAPKTEAQKQWLPSNFRLEIDGLDATKVNRIDSFTVKQTAVQDEVGDARDYQMEPGKLEFPNLKITLPVSSADTWIAWHEEFVIKGNNGQDKEKNGTLTLLSTNRQEVLATVRLFNMGIISIKEAANDSNSDSILRYEVELYVERMEFEGPGGVKK